MNSLQFLPSFPTELNTQLDPYYEEPSPITPLSDFDGSGPHFFVEPPSPDFTQSFQYSPEVLNDQAFLPPYPISNPQAMAMFDNYTTTSPFAWDCSPEADTFRPSYSGFRTPNQFAFAHETFTASHHRVVVGPRTFRGRKSKCASEVLDEHRPFACDICQAAFARSHDRDRHKRSHTGETPYHCHGCGTGFKRPDARKRHWERDPLCAQEDWIRVRHTPEGARRRARAKTRSSVKKPSK